ncbi:MAG TPA: BatA domain-containing protein, partial [Bacteroidia bacterium]
KPMTFLYPAFLFGLFALAIPIIIHLFNFRRFKKVYFTNVRFLKELKQETESKSKLKHLLILISRLLAITCLVMVFAQPILPVSDSRIKTGQKAISVYIDNSFSMESVSKNGLLFEVAKNKAREIAGAFGDADKFQLLTNDFEGKHQRLVSKEEFLQLLDECKISPAFKSTSEIYNRQKDLLVSSGANDKRNYIISDFQKNMADIAAVKTDSAISTAFVPLTLNNSGNLYIDTCWFDSPVQQSGMIQKLHVSIINNSANTIENGIVKLYINKKLVSPATFKMEPESKTDVVISYLIKDVGLQQCYVEIEDHPVTFDDRMYFSYQVKKNIPTLVINGTETRSAGYFNSLMKNDSLFSYSEMNEKNIDFSKFASTDFIILNGISTISSGLSSEIRKFVDNGGTVFILPAMKSDIASYNSMFGALSAGQFTTIDTVDTKADKINYAQGLYEGVFEKKQEDIDLPKIYLHYSSGALRPNEDVIIRLLNGKSFLSSFENKAGKVYVCTSPLDDEANNFARHALFVPTVIRMAINSTPGVPLYFKSSANEVIALKNETSNKEGALHITDESGKLDLIPEMRKQMGLINLYPQNQLKEAGNYFIKEGTNILNGVSFNYSRKESELAYTSPDDLKKEILNKGDTNLSLIEPSEKNISSSIAELSSGTKLWKLFLILTLTFLLTEILLIRFFK